ncbi:MAG: calcium-binding protein [Cyanobacteria bacterium P01_B01_bin.77]
MAKTYHGNNNANVKKAHRTGIGRLSFWRSWEMFGYGGNDVLTGGDKDDLLNGGTGIDRLVGGKGSDKYVVDNSRDTVIEAANEGHDVVESTATFQLGRNVEDLTLKGYRSINGTGNELNNVLKGNSKNNVLRGRNGRDVLYGNGGDDVLDGGSGIDRMFGGTGNDTYIVDHRSDQVTESRREGIDTVEAHINNYRLGSNVENLKLGSSFRVTEGHGNFLNNEIIGNRANNYLYGHGGRDHISGGAGNDVLIGGDGNDTLVGMTTTNRGEVDRLVGGDGADRFQLHNRVSSQGQYQTYSLSGYAVIDDFDVYEGDKITVLGSGNYQLQSRDFFGDGVSDTVISQGNNIIGVVSNNTNISMARDFQYL